MADDERDVQLAVVPDPDQAPPSHDDAEHLKLVAEAMRHIADQQTLRAERVRSSARQTFAYLSAFFAVAQAVSFSDFRANSATSPDEQTTIILMGIAAVILLGATGVLTVIVDRLKTAADASPEDIIMQADLAVEKDEHVAERLIKVHMDNADARADAIKSRARIADWVNFLAVATVGIVLVEILTSLIARLP